MDPISTPTSPQFDISSPNIHLFILKRRVPHLFSFRRRHRSPRRRAMSNLSINMSTDRTVDNSVTLKLIARDLAQGIARRRYHQVPGQPAASQLQVQFYELGILSRHLLHSDSPDEAWTKRWEDILDKVARAYATVLGEDPKPGSTSTSQEDICMKYNSDIERWIKEDIPRHVAIIQDVLGEPDKAALVASLGTIRRNLTQLSSIFPNTSEARINQLESLMSNVMAGLQRVRSDSQERSAFFDDAVDPDQLKQLGEQCYWLEFRDFQDLFDADSFDSDASMYDAQPAEGNGTFAVRTR
ncbi:hypothetical protein BD414DRAFT_236070 [Trametes punicea]|nr:hypothetical protein BD414DRAFT_236070 [Trametes punicea]